MSKFKVGDKVKVIDEGGDYSFRKGEIVTVSKTTASAYGEALVFVQEHGGAMFERRFELVPPVVKKFTKGDRVKTIQKLHGDARDIPVGTEGTVRDQGGCVYPRVTFDNGQTWCAYPDAIEVITPPPAPKKFIVIPLEDFEYYTVATREDAIAEARKSAGSDNFVVLEAHTVIKAITTVTEAPFVA